MNKINGHISKIQESKSLSIVRVDVGYQLELQAIVIDISQSAEYLGVGKPISLIFKETEVIIGLDKQLNSISNQIPCSIKEIEKGELLTRLILSSQVGQISAVIPSDALKRLGLNLNQEVIALIKLNEIMLTV